MPDLGPTWSHTTQSGEHTGTWGTEVVLDVFIWRTKRMGRYLEPSYGITFGSRNQKLVSLTGGVFFAVSQHQKRDLSVLKIPFLKRPK
jgi:hypothetical protein